MGNDRNPRSTTGEQSCKATVNEPCEYGGLWRQCDRHRMARVLTASPAPKRDLPTHCPTCGLPAESLHDETACNVIVELRSECEELRAELEKSLEHEKSTGITMVQAVRATTVLRAERDELWAAFKRMDAALTSYWAACNEIESCGDPECDGECEASRWEEFAESRNAMRLLTKEANDE